MPAPEYLRPASVGEAVALLGERGVDATVLAGGTGVLPRVHDGSLRPGAVVSLRGAGLRYVERAAEAGGVTRLGAMATLADVSAGGDDLLARAAGDVGGPAIRAMSTVGGNLLADSPHGDLAVALLARDAEVVVVSAGGERTVPLADLWSGGGDGGGTRNGDLAGPGGALVAGALIREVRVPAPVAGWSAFAKFGRRARNTPAVVTLAVVLELDGEAGDGGRVVRRAWVAVGGAGPRPWRATEAEARLEGAALGPEGIDRAAAAAAAAARPADDAVASATYRRRMLEVQLRRVLVGALGTGEGSQA